MNIALVNQPLDGSLPPTQTSLSIRSHQVARRLATLGDVWGGNFLASFFGAHELFARTPKDEIARAETC